MKNHYFFSQPHQPFFVLGFLNAIVSMFVFMLIFKGNISSELSTATYHAYSLIFLMFTPAFLAFLFTTFPRFSGQPPIEKVVYITILVPFTVGSLLLLLGAISFSEIASIGMVITLIGHLIAINILRKIYQASTITDKYDMFWILLAMTAGGVSHLLFVIGYFSDLTPLLTFSIQVAIYLYLFLLTFSVAQRMIPFFSHCMMEKDKTLLRNIALLLGIHVLLETLQPHLSFVADFALMYIIASKLLDWELPFPNPNPLLWILHIALFWIPTAFLFSGVSNLVALFADVNFLSLDIHVLMLGFVLTTLIGFGTRVTLGHSGNMMKADKWTTILFYWTQVVVISRTITSLIVGLGWNFLFWFDLTVSVWLVLFIIWAIRFFAVLIFGKKLSSEPMFREKK
ncbi:MAG: NnrS family protein [Epsilonproteobacteria bacterium]|nr:NnrS family protein [Campylobacterota bacterium]